ncbi:MAG: ABC transporter ATP-binding protein [Planctomycetes bacterium]|nr:ABC transporter ATP-binding protein [Planctomycetota bacterium]
MSSPLLETRSLGKVYRDGPRELTVLRSLDFSLEQGSHAALIGPSGCGKSTFLNLVGLMDQATQGEVLFSGEDSTRWPQRRRDDFRARHIGLLFQDHLLLPEFTLLENICIPLALKEGWTSAVRERALDLMERLGLGGRAAHLPCRLSGGEAQRGAIARALISHPDLILLDEPTGNLDPELGLAVMDAFYALARERGFSSLLVTHNHKLAQKSGCVFELRDQRLEHLSAASA